ncbi:unnamed protein product [Rotaria sordida]|uniref:Uncharacterized protein n=1 Tax=Rotaria sordida TaxID=392033 RepID=A0A814YBC7_9BILA|nr:unnamed protein product [Rotaria sordida]CAF1223624.1 unnamed protein product [Rotaria sordida]CAF1227254.1 unnamed protein product [Rotaria sordida]CAF1300750.1 unnamed protein product [Rotaria sordida]CAF1508500.1 unnamed protein product [Rotaria sordida]
MVLQSGDLLIDIGGEVYGQSPLPPLISIPVQSILDYFHLTLEIHLVFLLNQRTTIFPKPVHIQMNRLLLSIKYPHTIKRHPVDIESTGKWKATQLRVSLSCITLPFAVHYYIPQPYRRQPSAQKFIQPSTPTPAAILKTKEDVSTDIDIRGAIEKINLRLELLENNVK